MRLALDATTDAGRRAGLILLNGTGLNALGLVDTDPRPDGDPRVSRVGELAEFDAVITDRSDPLPLTQQAQAAGIPLVSWVDVELPAQGTTVLVGANLAVGITAALAFHEAARSEEVLEEVLAWTEPGKPLRKGVAVAFPDPVGARWGVEVESRTDPIPATLITVPVAGDWAGASAQVTCASDGGIVRRVVGVADLAGHLEGIALAAGGATVGEFPAGLHRPVDAAEVYLSKALEMGLAVASYVEGTDGRR